MSVDWLRIVRFRRIAVFALLAGGLPGYAQEFPVLPGGEDFVGDGVEVPEEEPDIYSVEVIVFKYASSVSSGTEIFEPEPPPEADPFDSFDPFNPDPAARDPMLPGDAGPPEEEQAPIEYGDFVEPEPVEPEEQELEEIRSLSTIGFRRLQADELTMTGIHEKLTRLDAYQPILWGGWTQEAAEEEQSLPIDLRRLDWPPLAIKIDGNFKLYLKNYLHLVVDLTLQQTIAAFEPVYRFERRSFGDAAGRSDFGNAETDTQTILYQIQEDRIFRSGHLRYFDHPKFGVLVRVNRLEPGDLQQDEETQLEQPELLSLGPTG